MDAIPEFDEDLVAKSLAELADADYQAQVWSGRVPTVSSSLVACYAALYGESGLAESLDHGEVFSPEIDDELGRLRELLERVDARQPVRALLADRALVEARALAAGILRDVGVHQVIKRGLPELDLPLQLPGLPLAARVGLAAVLAIAVLAAVLILVRPQQPCENPLSSDTVSAYSCR